MQNPNNEIELKTYSISYAYPVTYPSQLPYSWECERQNQVLINTSFYSSAILEPNLEDDREHMEEPQDQEGEYEKMEDCSREDESLFSCDNPVQSANDGASTKESSTKSYENSAIDKQLDFIFESVKRQPKDKLPPKPKLRNRKTPSQLAALTRELGGQATVDKEKIRKLAKELGLKEVQVYKWYWDQKAKSN